MKRAIILAALLLAGCTDADHAKALLRKNGYTDVQITGYRWFSCGKGDDYATGFRAKAPNGETIDGTVCAGWFLKGATIRFE